MHQQNVCRSGSHTQTSQTLRWPSPVLLSTSWCSRPPLELWNVLSDSARAFSCAPESTCSDGSAFRMLQNLTIRIVKFWSCWDHCAGLQETSRAAPLHKLCRRLGVVFSQQWFLRFNNHKAFHRSNWSDTVTRFATSYYGVSYLSLSI